MAPKEEPPELSLSKEERGVLVSRVQQDWKDREFVEVIELNIMQIVSFLNTFDQSARYKLARINEKLSRLEHTLEYAEAAIKNTSPVADDETES